MKDSAYLKGFGRTATHLIALGVKSRDAWKFQQHVERLVKTRGTKGALAWLEAFGQLVSERVFKIRLRRKTWVSRKWLHVFRRCKKHVLMQRLTKIKRAITERQITAQQSNKFLSAVHRDQPDERALEDAKALIAEGVDTMVQFLPRNHRWKPRSCYAAYVKRELSRGKDETEAYLSANRKIMRDVGRAKILNLLGVDPIRETLKPLNLIEVERMASAGLRFVEWKQNGDNQPPVGSLHVTQEPGGKARFYGSPDLLYQEATAPLQEFLMACLHATPQDACYNVGHAISDIQRRLRAGQTVYTYDLTQATDAFPSPLTWYALLRTRRIPLDHYNLLLSISKGLWSVSEEISKTGLFPTEVRWTVGQPLGTKPSFAAFAFSHHSLVRGIARSLGRDPNCYYIIGDDIVIFDPDVAEKYRQIMLALGVQMPEEKSMVSDRVSEFGGQTILRSEAFYPGKWREVNDDSLFTFIMDPAYDIARVVPKLWLRLIRRMQETPYPFGLLRPQLEKLSHEQINELADTIELMFLKRMFTPHGTEPWRPDWLNDIGLVKRLAWNTDWATMLYPHDGRLDHLDRANFTARVYRANEDISFADKMFPKGGSLPCLFWKEAKVTDWFETEIPNTNIDEACNILRGFVALSDNQKRDFIVACRLIRSILQSAHNETLIPQDWVDTVPLLYETFASTRRDIEHIDLVHAVISGFPHYEVADFHVIRTRFLAILRRYSKPTEVMPSLAVQLPRLRVGSLATNTSSLSS